MNPCDLLLGVVSQFFTIIDALAELVVAFPGAANRMRCFTHILNLVVKVILRQFEVPKAQADEALDVASRALVELAGENEIEEEAMDDGNGEDDNGVDGWIDPREEMSQDELDELDLTVRPVRLVLVKVSSNSSQTLIGVLALTWNPAAKTCICDQKLNNYLTSLLGSAPRRSCKRC